MIRSPMQVESPRLARAWAFELGPTAFRRLAFAAALALYAIVVTGATVRLTGSGLGCEGWPGCSPGNPFPEKDYHSFIEFGNRVFGLVPILLTLATGVAAWRSRLLVRDATRLAVAVAAVTALQAPIGLATIRLDLHPVIVMLHFLLAILALGGAVVVALEARRVEHGARTAAAPRDLRRLAVALAATCLALVVTGMLVTSAGPHAGDPSEIERLGRLPVAIALHVPASGLFAASLLFTLGYLFAHRERYPRLLRLGGVVLALLLVQTGVGELQWQTELPWWLVLVHVAVAAAIWATTVALATLLWRPSFASSGGA